MDGKSENEKNIRSFRCIANTKDPLERRPKEKGRGRGQSATTKVTLTRLYKYKINTAGKTVYPFGCISAAENICYKNKATLSAFCSFLLVE